MPAKLPADREADQPQWDIPRWGVRVAGRVDSGR